VCRWVSLLIGRIRMFENKYCGEWLGFKRNGSNTRWEKIN
jgi:hypothetical protein